MIPVWEEISSPFKKVKGMPSAPEDKQNDLTGLKGIHTAYGAQLAHSVPSELARSKVFSPVLGSTLCRPK